MTSLHPPRDVISSRASTWRDTAEYSQLSSGQSDLLQTVDTNTDTYTRLPRRRSIGPVWPDHRDREISALLDPSLATEDAPKRRQTEAIPIPESADASGLHRSQAWEFQASYDVRQERVRRRLQKAQQITEQYARECSHAGMNPCQYGWRMGHEYTGDCPRPALPSGAFCSWHTCTAMSHDGERCSNIVYKPEVLIKQGLFRVCRTGYHIENQQWPHLNQAIAHNQAVLACEAEQASARDEEHLQRYAQITGETESTDGYTIYTQLNNNYASRKRSDMSRKPSALDLSTTSRRPSFSEQPTPLLTSRSAQSSADSTKLRTPVTPLPAKDWPLYTLDAALLKVQLDNACSQPPTPSIAIPKATNRLQPSPQIVVPPAKLNTRRDVGLSIEIIPVSADSPISPSPSNLQMRRASLSPVSAKPALPTVDEDEEGHPSPARSPSPRPLFSSSPLPIAMTSSRRASSAHLAVSHTSPASAQLSASPASASATSQLQLVLGQAKRTPATSVSIDRTSFGGTSRQSFRSAASHQTTSTITDGSAVKVVMPHIRLATGDECLTVKERLAARKVEGAKKVHGGGVRMAKMMRGRMGDGFMHRSAWGRTQQMDEDLLAVQPV